ncbi:MAG: hypothetical protein IKM53_06235 [Clostridia bacterium]|nr:hypothetical protein [Clostridia bacterium]
MARKVFRLASPLFLFFVLFSPYSIVNRRFIVEWFGCGCPKIDELGNVVQNDFNANDFTAIFWLLVTVAVVSLSALNLKLMKKRWLKAVYISSVAFLSLLISYSFCQTLMWN